MEGGLTQLETWFLTRRFWVRCRGLLIAGAMVWFSYPHVERLYNKGKANRLARSSASTCATGDYKSALLQASRALGIDRNNVLATRTVARSLDAVGAPEAIQWHRRLEELQPGDIENLIAWAKETLKAGDPASAGLLLKKVGASSQNSALYHDVAAQVAASSGDADNAISHWKKAAKIDPSEGRYKLNTAALQIRFANPDIRAAALAGLDQLRTDPKTRLAATRLLLQDAANQHNSDKVHELAKFLDNEPDAGIQDQLAKLTAFRVLDDPDFLTELEQLQAGTTKTTRACATNRVDERPQPRHCCIGVDSQTSTRVGFQAAS